MPKKETTIKVKTRPKKTVGVTKKTSESTSSKIAKNPRKKGVPKSSVSMKSKTVVLPKKVRTETLIKTQLIRSTIERDIHRAFYIVAYVAAFCFMLVGSSLAISSLYIPEDNSLSLAQLSSSLNETQKTEEVIDSSLETTRVETFPKSYVDLLNDIPENLTDKFTVKFVATHTDYVESELRKLPKSTNVNFRLTTNKILEDKYSVLLDPAVLEPAYYELWIHIKPQNPDSSTIFTTKAFFAGTDDQEHIYNNPERYIETQTPTDESKTFDVTDSEIINNSTSTFDYQKSPITETVSEDTLLDKTSLIEKEPENTKAFVITTSNQNVFGITSVLVEETMDLDEAVLYARPLNSLTSRYVTSAIKTNSSLKFVFDTNTIPNGKYEFFAITTENGMSLTSNSINLYIQNEVVDDTTPYPTQEITSDEDFSKPIELSLNSSSTEISEYTKEVLNQSDYELNDLLKRYAAALRADDSILIDISKDELDKYVNEQSLRAFDVYSETNIADDVSLEIEQQVKMLQERIVAFKNIEFEKNSGKYQDTDNDGISDVDEIHIFQTNPMLADTDNDGVTDGIEIMKGYSPIDDSPEAIIVYESPKEFTWLERADVLEIASVKPILSAESQKDKQLVRSEITGKALPNSFVTLYIFSEPLVVTVKTDSDGSFVYTLDKELEDGQHEIYVAVTDNSGAIIAQSQPFSFIKRAEAYEPLVSSTENELKVSETLVVQQNDSYGTILGVALLAFGLILLMLGIGLRSKKEINELIQSLDEDSSESKIVVKEKVLETVK